MAEIKPIPKNSVHRICSGQVVLNLAVAVKELVENALDAGSTSVVVKLKDYGLELIEVQDNGIGIEEKNFQALAKKHYTSKLETFEDMTSVSTFGFRGEALSSLCAVSQVSVQTATDNEGVGRDLVYNLDGILTSNKPCAAERGTIVRVENLFFNMPVRIKELQKNKKREFNKLVALLQGYCMICPEVQFTVLHIPKKSSKRLVLKTKGGADTPMENAITAVFGPKSVKTITKIIQSTPPQNANANDNSDADADDDDDDDDEAGSPNIDDSDNDDGEKVEIISKDNNGKNEKQDEGMNTTEKSTRIINIDTLVSNTQSSSVKRKQSSQSRKAGAPPPNLKHVKIDGFVSKPMQTLGRSSSDRQFFFVNGRPFDHSKLTKAVNEAYRQYNKNEFPFVVMHIQMPKSSVDVNVTPDKRTLLLQREQQLLEVVKEAVKNTLAKFEGTLLLKQPSVKQLFDPFSTSSTSKRNGGIVNVAKRQQRPGVADIMDAFQQQSHTSHDANPEKKPKLSTIPCDDSQKQLLWTCRVVGCSKFMSNMYYKENVEQHYKHAHPHRKVPNAIIKNVNDNDNDERVDEKHESCDKEEYVEVISMKDKVVHHQQHQLQDQAGVERENEDLDHTDTLQSSTVHSLSSQESLKDDTQHELGYGSLPMVLVEGTPLTSQNNDGSVTTAIPNRYRSKPSKRKLKLSWKVCLQHFRETLKGSSETATPTQIEQNGEENSLHFNAEMTSTNAEGELSTQIKKTDFNDMEILGQFNLGFIVTRLGKHLFIVDQHASDEKYNFERLQQTTIMKKQTLIRPKPLDLSAVDESIVMDNLEVFQKNGFEFIVDKGENALVGKRVKLTQIPYSKHTQFGESDIQELIFLLRDKPGVLCRPSRVRAMFASRACRSSIMIGRALTRKQMTKVVRHMATIEQPWNCPHGRPTMRHVLDLNMMEKEQQQRSEEK